MLASSYRLVGETKVSVIQRGSYVQATLENSRSSCHSFALFHPHARTHALGVSADATAAHIVDDRQKLQRQSKTRKKNPEIKRELVSSEFHGKIHKEALT